MSTQGGMAAHTPHHPGCFFILRSKGPGLAVLELQRGLGSGAARTRTGPLTHPLRPNSGPAGGHFLPPSGRKGTGPEPPGQVVGLESGGPKVRCGARERAEGCVWGSVKPMPGWGGGGVCLGLRGVLGLCVTQACCTVLASTLLGHQPRTSFILMPVWGSACFRYADHPVPPAQAMPRPAPSLAWHLRLVEAPLGLAGIPCTSG